jgi:peptidyl-prolyl cis-trans isomerase SurA
MEDEHKEHAPSETTSDTGAEENTNTVAPTIAAASEPTGAKSNGLRIVVALAVVLLLIAAGYLFFTRDGAEPLGDATGSDNLSAVATVNGVGISQAEYDRSLSSISQDATLQGADLADPAVVAEIEDQALTMVINNELLIQAAGNAGYSATAEEVDAQYAAVEAQFGNNAELAARMAEVGLTEEDLRSDIEKQIAVNTFVNEETNLDEVTVTDEEVETFIASLNIDAAEMPPLEEIRPQIESSLITQKQQEIIDAFIASLKGSANIEVHI